MSELTEIVDSLENRISKLLHKYENLKQNHRSLEEEMTAVKEENQSEAKQSIVYFSKLKNLFHISN